MVRPRVLLLGLTGVTAAAVERRRRIRIDTLAPWERDPARRPRLFKQVAQPNQRRDHDVFALLIDRLGLSPLHNTRSTTPRYVPQPTERLQEDAV